MKAKSIKKLGYLHSHIKHKKVKTFHDHHTIVIQSNLKMKPSETHKIWGTFRTEQGHCELCIVDSSKLIVNVEWKRGFWSRLLVSSALLARLPTFIMVLLLLQSEDTQPTTNTKYTYLHLLDIIKWIIDNSHRK